jgi:hypothetical protein
MEEIWFQIDLAMPVAMTVELQRDIIATIRPRWHVTGIAMDQLEKGVFRLKVTITPVEGRLETPNNDELREFRDLIVSLVAFSAMVPVHLRSMGIFDFPVDGNQRKQTSLGPMNYQIPPTPLIDLQPLVLGLALQPKYTSALHFLWEAINSNHQLYRFINLAVAIELIVTHDSPISGSRHPHCGDPKCSYEIEKCPKCGRSWNIPFPLRERAAFLLTEDILSDFIHSRNQVFHGISDELHHGYSKTLPDLNVSLLMVLRNYLGQKMGLPAIGRDQLGVAMNLPEIAMTVFYSLPSPTET